MLFLILTVRTVDTQLSHRNSEYSSFERSNVPRAVDHMGGSSLGCSPRRTFKM